MTRNHKKSGLSSARNISLLRVLLSWFVILLFCIFVYEIIFNVLDPKLLPVTHVKMVAVCKHVSGSDVKKHIFPMLRGFFSTNVMDIKQELMNIPFVDEVAVRRLWPDTLLIEITEQQLVARWGKAAVNSKGVVVNVPVDSHKNLPIFVGPEGQAANILQMYRDMSVLLQQIGVTITQVDLTSRRSWQLTLSHGVKVVLGCDNILFKLEQLIALWPTLYEVHGKSIAVIDLRYTNGLAVRVNNSQDAV
jgi:cell division protein FtsQ